jgi:hypothetical protein
MLVIPGNRAVCSLSKYACSVSASTDFGPKTTLSTERQRLYGIEACILVRISLVSERLELRRLADREKSLALGQRSGLQTFWAARLDSGFPLIPFVLLEIDHEKVLDDGLSDLLADRVREAGGREKGAEEVSGGVGFSQSGGQRQGST